MDESRDRSTDVMTSRRTRNLLATRQQLLDAGTQLLSEVTGPEITVAAITERADLALSTFYGHFDSLPVFLDHLDAEKRSVMTDYTCDAFADVDPADGLVRWIVGLCEIADDHPEHMGHAIRMYDGQIGEWGELDRVILDALHASGWSSPHGDDELAVVVMRAIVRTGLKRRVDCPGFESSWTALAAPALRVTGFDVDETIARHQSGAEINSWSR